MEGPLREAASTQRDLTVETREFQCHLVLTRLAKTRMGRKYVETAARGTRGLEFASGSSAWAESLPMTGAHAGEEPVMPQDAV